METCFCIGASCSNVNCSQHPNYVPPTTVSWTASPSSMTPDRVREIIAEELDKYEVDDDDLEVKLREIVRTEIRKALAKISRLLMQV